MLPRWQGRERWKKLWTVCKCWIHWFGVFWSFSSWPPHRRSLWQYHMLVSLQPLFIGNVHTPVNKQYLVFSSLVPRAFPCFCRVQHWKCGIGSGVGTRVMHGVLTHNPSRLGKCFSWSKVSSFSSGESAISSGVSRILYRGVLINRKTLMYWSIILLLHDGLVYILIIVSLLKCYYWHIGLIGIMLYEQRSRCNYNSDHINNIL